jgi:acyl-coenzyme A thioesterase PaaI-like protein
MPDDAEVLTVELKVNLLAPAGGQRLVAEGEVVRAARTLTVCRGDAHADQGGERVHVATMLATMVRRRTAGQGDAIS